MQDAIFKKSNLDEYPSSHAYKHHQPQSLPEPYQLIRTIAYLSSPLKDVVVIFMFGGVIRMLFTLTSVSLLQSSWDPWTMHVIATVNTEGAVC